MIASVRKNFLFVAASNLLAPVFSMALVLAIGRLRGVEVLGKYSLVMTVFIVGQSIAGFGLPVVITREVAKAPTRAGRYFVNACLLTLVFLLPALLIALIVLRHTVADPELGWALFLVLVALLPTSITQYGEAVLLAFERAGDFVAIGLGETILRACVGTVLVLSGHSIAAVALVIVVLRLLASATFVAVLRWRGVNFPRRMDRDVCRELASYIPVVGTIPIVNAVYARADMFLLSSLASWTEVGFYSAALRIVDIARTIPPAYGKALYPVLSRLRASSPEKFSDLSRRSVRGILLLSVPAALLLSGLAPPIITTLYGPALAPAAISLRVLAWTLVPVSLANVLAQVLFAMNRQAIDLRTNVIATAVSVAANLVLIPRWGAIGAAGAVLFSALVYVAVQYSWLRRYSEDPASNALLAKFALVIFTSLGATLLLPGGRPLMSAMVGVALCGGGMALTGIFERADS